MEKSVTRVTASPVVFTKGVEMIWHRTGMWAWVSDCSKYSVSASKLDDLRHGYTAWHTGVKPAVSLQVTLDAQAARDACEKHWRGAMGPVGETDELNFGQEEVQR